MNKLLKFLVVVVLTMITLILLKTNANLKENFYKYVYASNISFASINNWYESKFGSPIPFSSYVDKPVFNETLKYTDASIYKDGVKLTVAPDYLVPTLETGIVIFTGDKEGYGKTVIVEGENGVETWYSNLTEINVQLYDYISSGSLIGSVDEYLYLVFIKDGEVMDYKEYI